MKVELTIDRMKELPKGAVVWLRLECLSVLFQQWSSP